MNGGVRAYAVPAVTTTTLPPARTGTSGYPGARNPATVRRVPENGAIATSAPASAATSV